MQILGQGAEAVIYRAENGNVIKERTSKNYRLAELDKKLRLARTRREAKVLQKLQNAKIPAPALLDCNDETMKITMEFVDGRKMRDILHENPEVFSKDIGTKIGLLHSNDIIHSDLTTSNMIFDKETKFIDFGLSFFSKKIEDKAVDLHLFKQALESRHHEICKKCFESTVIGYKESYSNADEVLKRLEAVEKRGRNKNK